MMDVIRKRPKPVEENQNSMMPKQSGIGGIAGNGGDTAIGMQQAPAAQYGGIGAGGIANGQQHRPSINKQQFNDKRGSDFKKTAAAMFKK